MENKPFSLYRELMVKMQLERRGIKDSFVLAAMREVPREEFVPVHLRSQAYEDQPLPIEEGQTISQPYIVARMAEALHLGPKDRVLEIGTGSGYAAAVLANLVAEVYTIEYYPKLAQTAASRLQRCGYSNVLVKQGDGKEGWKEHAPFQAISVTAGRDVIPKELLKQLDIGGRLIMPVGPTYYLQELIRVTRASEDDFRYEKLGAVRFVPFLGSSIESERKAR